MFRKIDVFAFTFLGLGGSGGTLTFLGILAQVSVVAILWLFILTISISMIGYIGTRMVFLIIGERAVASYYPIDRLEKALEKQRAAKKLLTTR